MATYQAYLLRLWRESEADPWRATLEDPHTGERLGFSGADLLMAYLTQQLAIGSHESPASFAPRSALAPSEPSLPPRSA
jgi:hypothetical protein